MIRFLFILILFLHFNPISAFPQGLKNSPREDTMYHFFPLDSNLLVLYTNPQINRDSLLFMHKPAIKIAKSKIGTVNEVLPYGTYLRVGAQGLFVEKEIHVHVPFSLDYILDGEQLLIFIKDLKTNRLRKDLRLYYQQQGLSFDKGKGAYVLDLHKVDEKKNVLLVKDHGAFFAFDPNLYLRVHNSRNAFSSGQIPAAGYMMLSKPRYKPGDTLDFYASLLTGKKGRPLRKKISLSLSSDKGLVWTKKIRRRRPGSYALQYPLSDTLLLDKTYHLDLFYSKSGQRFSMQRDFFYEDYQLDKAEYDFFLDNTTYKAGDSIRYYISAKDENGFAQPFGKYSLDVYVQSVNLIRRDTYTVNTANSLYHLEGSLSGEGLETHVLPPLAFPPGTSKLMATFRLVNELNEEKIFRREFEYDDIPYEFRFAQERDSLVVDYLYLRKSKAKTLRYCMLNEQGDTLRKASLKTPFKLPIGLDDNSVYFYDDTTMLRHLYINHSLAEQLGLQAKQSKDSVWIYFRSSGQSTVYYTILKNHKPILSDSALSLDLKLPANLTDQFDFTLARESAKSGSANYEHYYIYPEKKRLQISDNLPQSILPGSTLQVELYLKDFEGRPKKNVDLSSYAIKNQFKVENGTHTFYFLPPRKDTLFTRLQESTYYTNGFALIRYNSRKLLNREEIHRLGLLGIPYYAFYFPQTVFEDDMAVQAQVKEERTAQLSIQVINKGVVYSPVWITADDKPIYYSVVAQHNLAILPAGKHHIRLRTADKELDLGVFDFKAAHKKILSFNVDSLNLASSPKLLRDSLPAFSLDTNMVDKMIAHSYFSLGLPFRESYLHFDDMQLYLFGNDFQMQSTSAFLGNNYQFFGPYYTTVLQREKDTLAAYLHLGNHAIQFYSQDTTLVKTLAIPSLPWPSRVNTLSYEQVFDTLYYPVKSVPYQQQYLETVQQERTPEVQARFGNFYPSAKDAWNLVVLDPSSRIIGMAVVQRNQIDKSLFYAGPKHSLLNYRIAASDKVDLFFEFEDGTNTVYRDVSVDSISHLYVNADSLRAIPVSKSDEVFYQNVYSSLTSKFKELFSNYPEKVKVSFEKSNRGRKSSMINGRLIGSEGQSEDVYLEEFGRFVSGARTDEQGNFRFLDVAPGKYMIKVHPVNQRPLYVYNLDVHQGDEYSLTIQVEPDEAPLVLSALNPHFELQVRNSAHKSTIQLFDADHKDLLSDARFKVLIGEDTIYTTRIQNNRFDFPIQEWPTGAVVSLLIDAPGYEHLWVKNFRTEHEYQYSWRCFLQKRLDKKAKENELFVNGTEIGNYIPSFYIEQLPSDSLRSLKPTSSGICLRFDTSSGANTAKEDLLRIRLYRSQRLFKQFSVSANRLADQVIRLDTGDYRLEVYSEDYRTQVLDFHASQAVDYQLSLHPFWSKQASKAQALVARNQQRVYKDQSSLDHMPERSNASYTVEKSSNRQVEDVVALTAGVAQRRSGGELRIGGARGDGTLYLMDGQLVNGEVTRESIQKGTANSAIGTGEAAEMKANPLMQQIRRLFSDKGHFVTGLISDKFGRVVFEASFPDDITLWDVHHVALGRKYYWGESVKQLRAYKPVMVNMRLPRYMYVGDSLELGAHFRNLMEAKQYAHWRMEVNKQVLLQKEGGLDKGFIDSVYFKANTLAPLRFYAQLYTADSFVDRELRLMPVKENCVMTHYDTAYAIQDTLLNIYKAANEEVQLRISHSLIECLDYVAQQLKNYPYDCLEQKCSKLKGLIYSDKIAKRLGKKTNNKNDINKLIHQIEKNQNSDGSFAWWSGAGNVEMTLIAWDALQAAHLAGYTVKANDAAQAYLLNYCNDQHPESTIDILNGFLSWKKSIKQYKHLVLSIDQGAFRDVFDQLQWQRLKAYYTDSFDRTAVLGIMQMLEGQMYLPYASTRFVREPHVLMLRAFRLFKETPLSIEIGVYMQQYVRSGEHTRTHNTYEQALVMENFYDFSLPSAKQKSHYRINQAKPKNTFPYTLQLKDSVVQIAYSGSEAWLNIDRIRKDDHPSVKDSFFRVQTQIDGLAQENNITRLQLNKHYEMEVSVFNYLPYQHVMITIPLASGLQLSHKIPYRWGIEHVEYYHDRIVLYCSILSAGKHVFRIPLRAAFKGRSSWPPVRAELMYRPEIYGHNVFRTLVVE